MGNVSSGVNVGNHSLATLPPPIVNLLLGLLRGKRLVRVSLADLKSAGEG